MSAQQYFEPLAKCLVENSKRAETPYFVAINGCQGSGKSTLADYLANYIRQHYPLNVVVMSLDDFYLSSAERQKLAQDVHPLLATRGVPGTHNMQLFTSVLQQLKAQQLDFCIPRFDKAMDEPCHSLDWPYISEKVDLVIVEGWCLGAQPVDPQQLRRPVNELEQSQDSQGTWRQYVNAQLALNYQPLYAMFDYWILLKAPSFDCVYQWRLEQESKLVQRAKQKHLADHKIMSAVEIAVFIQYFQRITMSCLTDIPQFADCQFVLDKHRIIQSVLIKE